MNALFAWLQRKMVWITMAIIGLVITLITVISVKILNPYKPAFYIFSGYLDQTSMKVVDQKYSLKEYGDINEFDYALSNQKAMAGVTSDYLIINLINEGKLAPVSKEMQALNNIQSKTDYLNFFTDEAQSQMQFYDQFISAKTQQELRKKYPEYLENNINYDFTFSDFVVPYFMNDQVYAFDTKKILGQTFAAGEKINPLGFSETNGIPLANSMIEAVNKIVTSYNQKNGVKIQWVKNEIENTILGTEFNGGIFSTQLTNDNYKQLLDNFSQMVLQATGHKMSETGFNLFETDSDVILNNLINPDSYINVATLYNGDALDAYWGNDNFKSITDGDRLRIIRSKNSIRILDAFVVSSDISTENKQDLLKFFNEEVFAHTFSTKAELDELYAADSENFYKQKGMLRIFDYVNYTVSAKGVYEFLVENYFTLEENEAGETPVDPVALDIFKISPTAKPIYPVSKELSSNLTALFQQKLNAFS